MKPSVSQKLWRIQDTMQFAVSLLAYIYIYVYRLPVSKDDFNVKAIIQSTFGTQTVANGCNGYIKGGVAPANPGSQWVID